MPNRAYLQICFSTFPIRCSLPVTSPILILCIVAFGGCGMGKSKSEAESVVSNHFAMIEAKNYEKALEDYSPLFFEKTPRDEWLTLLKNVESKLGSFQSFKTSGWNVRNQVGPAGNGTYVEITCDTTYAKYTARETFVLYKGAGNVGMKIAGHNINSNGLIKN